MGLFKNITFVDCFCYKSDCCSINVHDACGWRRECNKTLYWILEDYKNSFGQIRFSFLFCDFLMTKISYLARYPFKLFEFGQEAWINGRLDVHI